MTWWLWLVLGLFLLLLELLTPGSFFVFFFGAGALVVGMLAVLNLAGPQWAQWVLFAVISVIALLLLRNPLQRWMRSRTVQDVDQLTGETAVALQGIGARQIGKVELRGASWNAQNIGDVPIEAGQRCVVERVEGLTLHIHA